MQKEMEEKKKVLRGELPILMECWAQIKRTVGPPFPENVGGGAPGRSLYLNRILLGCPVFFPKGKGKGKGVLLALVAIRMGT